MTVTAQTIRGSDATVSLALVSASFGDVIGYQQGGGGFVFATGDPTGDLTPPSAGWEYTNVATGLKYLSTGTTSADWEGVLSSESLANTPTAAGLVLDVGSKSYMSAYHALSVAGTPYIMSHTITSGQEVTAIAPATETTPQIVGVPVTGGTVGLQWFQTRGQIEALVDGTADVAAGDFIQVITTGIAFVVDAAAIDVTSSAQAVDAQAADSAVSVTIILLGNTSTVAAT